MNKKTLIGIIIAVIILAGIGGYFLYGEKKTPKVSKMYKVGILNGFDYIGKNVEGFKAGMTELGYIEGKNIVYDVQKTNPDPVEYQKALQKFADEKVDLMFAFPTEASLEGKKVDQATGIPLVFSHANFEGMNLINSIKEPGNNLTGVRYPGPDVALKRLEIFLKILPNVKTIAIPYLESYPNVPPQMAILYEWAPKLGVSIIEVPVSSPQELQEKLDALLKDSKKIDAIMTLAEVVSATPSFVDVFAKFGEDHKIPVGGTLLSKEDGFNYETFFGVDADAFSEGRQAATLADKIFKGTPAGTIPVESAEMFFRVNYKKATEMGISLSEGLLSTANEIIR
ncbi:MAG: ABC transporter substrate-binding protein [Patescibacteria group bacterium]|jgi:putative ABC transport system substrate-binding protein